MKHLARSTDPSTSHQSAANTPKFAGGHKAIILEALQSGAKCAKELERCTGLTVVQIDRRMAELKRLQEVEVVALDDGAEVIREGCRVYRLTVGQLEMAL